MPWPAFRWHARVRDAKCAARFDDGPQVGRDDFGRTGDHVEAILREQEVRAQAVPCPARLSEGEMSASVTTYRL